MNMEEYGKAVLSLYRDKVDNAPILPELFAGNLENIEIIINLKERFLSVRYLSDD